MMLGGKKFFWLIFLFVLVVYYAVPKVTYWRLNYLGYCHQEERWLSDEEKIAGALEYVNNRHTLPIGGNNYKQVKYSSIKEILAENPGCCQMVSSGDIGRPLFNDRIAGLNSTDIIRLNYDVRYLDENNVIQTKRIDYDYSVTNCGKVRAD